MSATKYVAAQLKSLLGTYLDGVSEESLGLQLLSGKLKLHNLKIRETAFADLELPFRASGTVGKMELSVNLLRHKFQPAIATQPSGARVVAQKTPAGWSEEPG